MNKKHQHKKKKQAAFKQTTGPSQIIFTLASVKILKDALAQFEVMLIRNDNKPLPNLELAQVTFHDLKQKLADMLEREEWDAVKPLDYNEIWILYASLSMYVLKLQLTIEGDKSKLPVCLALCSQFKGMIEAAK